jgi:hypothetical protein
MWSKLSKREIPPANPEIEAKEASPGHKAQSFLVTHTSYIEIQFSIFLHVPYFSLQLG